MRLPYLLLNRTDLKETSVETAKRRARALSEQMKRVRFEEALRDELATMQCLREAMTEPPASRTSRWRRSIAAE